MKHYMIVETRDPIDSRDHDWLAGLAADLKRAGGPTTLLLTENGVFAARNGAAVQSLHPALKAGCAILADRYALRERGIRESDLAHGVKAADIDVVIDALGSGACVLWR